MVEVDADTAPVSVAYLGPEATYTHQAALSSFPAAPNTPPPLLTPYPTIPSVFTAVQSGTSTYGVIPFENSTNGSVVASLDLFVDAAQQHRDVSVVSEAYVKVEHCLVGHHHHAHAADDLAHVTDVHSHPQVWTQCTSLLTTQLPHARRHDSASTSAAAALAAADPSGATVAISSALAAAAHRVPVLRRAVEDRGDNVTRFFVLRRRRDADVGRRCWRRGARVKSLVVFTLRAEVKGGNGGGEKDGKPVGPGALAEALSVFKPYGINLTSINARPSGEGPWRYCFLVEVVSVYGQREGEGDEEGETPLDKALRDLGGVVERWRLCGSWESMLE